MMLSEGRNLLQQLDDKELREIVNIMQSYTTPDYLYLANHLLERLDSKQLNRIVRLMRRYASSDYISEFPPELVETILNNMDVNQISKLCKTSKSYQSLCENNEYWYRRIKGDIGLYYEYDSIHEYNRVNSSKFSNFFQVYNDLNGLLNTLLENVQTLDLYRQSQKQLRHGYIERANILLEKLIEDGYFLNDRYLIDTLNLNDYVVKYTIDRIFEPYNLNLADIPNLMSSVSKVLCKLVDRQEIYTYLQRRIDETLNNYYYKDIEDN